MEFRKLGSMRSSGLCGMVSVAAAILCGSLLQAEEQKSFIAPVGEAIQATRDLAREWLAAHPGETCEIRLAAGVHFLKETLVLDSRDSGMRFVGEDGAVVSGGEEHAPEGKLDNGDWIIPFLGDERPQAIYTENAWVDIARYPSENAQESMLPIATVEHNAPKNVAEKSFSSRTVINLAVTPEPALPPSGYNVVVMKSWSLFRQSVEMAEGAAITLPNPTWLNNHSPKGDINHNFMTEPSRAKLFRCWFEGHLQFLSAPRQWAYDSEKKAIIYRPAEGEKFESARFIVPRLRQLIQIKGTADAPVQNIDFSNFQELAT